MNYLLTGSSGFLGSIVKRELIASGGILDTLGRKNSSIICDLSSQIPCLHNNYTCVVHIAGKAHSIPQTKAESEEFFSVNYQGTVNLCHALEKSGLPNFFIFISSVAVYGIDSGEYVTEEFPLLGTSPYAMSKIQAEFFLQEWASKHNVLLTILRPSLVVGKEPPGNLGAMISGIQNGRYLSIAGGKARKSVIMAEDIARVIPFCMEKGGIYNICDSYNPSFRELELVIAKQLHKPPPMIIPEYMAMIIAKIGDLLGEKSPINSLKLKKITETLTFSNKKLITQTGFQPVCVLDHFTIN